MLRRRNILQQEAGDSDIITNKAYKRIYGPMSPLVCNTNGGNLAVAILWDSASTDRSNITGWTFVQKREWSGYGYFYIYYKDTNNIDSVTFDYYNTGSYYRAINIMVFNTNATSISIYENFATHSGPVNYTFQKTNNIPVIWSIMQEYSGNDLPAWNISNISADNIIYGDNASVRSRMLNVFDTTDKALINCVYGNTQSRSYLTVGIQLNV